jgi:hypothetical protein
MKRLTQVTPTFAIVDIQLLDGWPIAMSPLCLTVE